MCTVSASFLMLSLTIQTVAHFPSTSVMPGVKMTHAGEPSFLLHCIFPVCTYMPVHLILFICGSLDIYKHLGCMVSVTVSILASRTAFCISCIITNLTIQCS